MPSAAVPCPLKLAGQKLELRVGAATPLKDRELVAINVGCHVGCMAWSPCGSVLALSVHNRRQPALGAEGPVQGLAALQLWRVAFGDAQAAQLRLGLVHQGAQARALQWMASKKAKAPWTAANIGWVRTASACCWRPWAMARYAAGVRLRRLGSKVSTAFRRPPSVRNP